MKVLIYSSKELFDNSSYEGRAEAHIIAYKKDDGYYKVVKNRTTYPMGEYTTNVSIAIAAEKAENLEYEREKASYESAN